MAKLIMGVNDLATVNQEVASEWHPTKNGFLHPWQVGHGSSMKVWWLGKCNHEWRTSVANRTRNGSGCPYCKNKKLLVGFNDLETVYPEIAMQWHPTKNGDLKPTDIMAGWHGYAWWLGDCDHEWRALVQSRTTGGPRGCPYCDGKKVLKGFNDLRTIDPDLAAQWHPTKNGDKTPEDYRASSSKSVWWLGKCGHKWKASISNRHSRRTGCPECRKQFKVSFPEKALYFYVKKVYGDAKENYKPNIEGINSNLELDIWIPSTRTAMEYDGSHWHDTERDVAKDLVCKECGIRLIRVREESIASYKGCSAEVVIRHDARRIYKTLDEAIMETLALVGHNGDVDVDTKRDETEILDSILFTRKKSSAGELYPDVVSDWDSEKNGGLTPWMFSPGSEKEFWFKCANGHEYKKSLAYRTRSGMCPICKKERKIRLQSTASEGKSIKDKNPKVASLWHPTKNGDKTADEVYAGSRKNKWWWLCPSCGNEWYLSAAVMNVRVHACTECGLLVDDIKLDDCQK